MDLAFPKTGAVVRWRGQIYRVVQDEPWVADDPFVKEHADLFDVRPHKVHSSTGLVEQATAAPGEKRKRG